LAARFTFEGVSMNHVLIDDGRVENPASRVDLAGGIFQGDVVSRQIVNRSSAGLRWVDGAAITPGDGGRVCAAVIGASDGGRSSFPNPDVVGLSVPPASDSTDPVRDMSASGVGRSELDDWRVSLHEGGHTVVGRALGAEVGGCTIVEGPDYGGLTWGPKGNSSRLSSVDENPDICAKITALMPAFGEPRVNAAEIFSFCHVRVVDLCAGTAAETILHPACAPWVAHSDIREARKIASMVCTSESAVDAYLAFGLAEAKALIEQHRAAVLAIAEALMVERTLNSEQIDNIIASAPAFARRAAWARVIENAATFTAENGMI
jgi:hypothetical protein